MRLVLLGTVTATALAIVVSVALAGNTSSGASLAFTDAQAAKGQSLYSANCALCHGTQLEGVYAPALSGPNGNLHLMPMSAVYGYMTVTMPVGNGGGLSREDYVDIMAFLLKEHGHKPGSSPLTASVAATSTAVLGP
jgi:cytochrome c